MWVGEALGCHDTHRREVLALAASVAAPMAAEPLGAEQPLAHPDALSCNEMAEPRKV